MATDGQDSRRKHRQSSSPQEVERSSKRHKHRHDRPRHVTSKRDAETVDTIHSSNPDPDIFQNNNQPVDDVEEGEILEEGSLPGCGGEIGRKQTESDAESGEIQVTGDRDVRPDKANVDLFSRKTSLRDEPRKVQINGRYSENNGEDINKYVTSRDMDREDVTWHQSCRIHKYDGSHKLSCAISDDGKDARASRDGRGNGYLDPKTSEVDRRQQGELEYLNGVEKLRGNYNEEALEFNRGEVSIHRNSSSESAGEKYKSSGHSSHNKRTSQTRSRGHTRDRSRSRSIVEEHTHSRRRHSREHDTLSYDGRNKTDIDIEEKRRVECDMEHRHGGRDIAVDDSGGHHSSRYTGKEDRHRSRGTNDRERSKDWRDVDMDLRREKSRNREIDQASGSKEERKRIHERERRDVEKDRSSGRGVDWDKRREKEQDRSSDDVSERDRRRKMERDRTRGRLRGADKDRERDSERDDKHRDRDRIRDRERQEDRFRCKDRDTMTGNDKRMKHEDVHVGRDRSRYSRSSRHEETENHLEKRKTSGPPDERTFMNTSSERGEDKLERGDDDQDDLDEKVTLQFAEQEEEDFNRVKEESRRRREAILEKYKKQEQQVAQTPEDEEKDKEPVDIPTPTSEVHGGKNDDLDVDDAETLFAVGKSPPKNGNVASEMVSGAGGLGDGTPKGERSTDNSDKYCDDIFGETPTGVWKLGKGDGLQVERGGQHDNWDDAEGYYSYRFGETLDGRYEVIAAHGRGVFSTVVRAKNLKAGNAEPEEVAVKIIRNNDTMYKAGMDELVILKKLVGADPDDKRHCVRFLSSFKYRNHLCLVFESLNMNLREVLKKFGRNIGLRLTAVRAYAKQLFIALKHLRNCGVLHCDIKPDNMLVNETKNVLKLCDFGNAMFAGKNEVTPYLVSRFYRAPEIILGLTYDHPLDMWSVGCCLYEIYTGKVLFPGATNNDMLRLHMELKGPFPKKMLRKGAFTEQHFDQDLNFLATEDDPVTKRPIKRMILNMKPKDIGTIITGSPGEDLKMLANFKDLLEKVFVLDPDKRLTVSQALNHPFITGK